MVKSPIEEWLPNLPKAAQEPQELELWCSFPAQYCIHFMVLPKSSSTKEFHNMLQYCEEFTAKRWCNILSHVAADNPSHSRPKSLPKGLFLICGDGYRQGFPLKY